MQNNHREAFCTMHTIENEELRVMISDHGAEPVPSDIQWTERTYLLPAAPGICDGNAGSAAYTFFGKRHLSD